MKLRWLMRNAAPLLIVVLPLVCSCGREQSKSATDQGCIDIHAHAITPAFMDAIKELGIDPIEEDGFPIPQWSEDAHLKFMESAGISHSVLTPPVPHIYSGDSVKSAVAVRKINQELHDMAAARPDKFSFAAMLPLPDVKAAIDEAVYALDVLGAVGARVATNMGGIYLGDSRLDPLMAELDRRKALVIIHPVRARQRPENVITGKVAAIYEYPADTTRAVLNMAANRVMTRYPGIKWVVPHCGAFLPYMQSRFAGVAGILASLGMMEKTDIKAELSGLYYDTAGDPEQQLEMLRLIADDSHIMFGSDFPHSPAAVIMAKKQSFEASSKYPKSIKNSICSSNAKSLVLGK